MHLKSIMLAAGAAAIRRVKKSYCGEANAISGTNYFV